jgi:hypothetical protein
MIYPNSVPEFRVLVKLDGSQVMQVRYVNIQMGYTGSWMDIPKVMESES